MYTEAKGLIICRLQNTAKASIAIDKRQNKELVAKCDLVTGYHCQPEPCRPFISLTLCYY